MTSCIARSTESPWNHHLEQPWQYLLGYYKSYFQTTYMDDSFVVFGKRNECDLFLHSLNSLHHSLCFTSEKESNLALSFLDVLVEKSPSKFHCSIYRKPTLTSQYLCWNSFSPQKLKTNLILTFNHRDLPSITLKNCDLN